MATLQLATLLLDGESVVAPKKSSSIAAGVQPSGTVEGIYQRAQALAQFPSWAIGTSIPRGTSGYCHGTFLAFTDETSVLASSHGSVDMKQVNAV